MGQFTLEDLLPTYDEQFMRVSRSYEQMIEAERAAHMQRIVSDCLHSKPEINFSRVERVTSTGVRLRVVK